MILTYEDYLPAPGSLTLEEMLSLHREIKEDAGHDEDALGLYKDLLAAAVKYSESRAYWPLRLFAAPMGEAYRVWKEAQDAEKEKT